MPNTNPNTGASSSIANSAAKTVGPAVAPSIATAQGQQQQQIQNSQQTLATGQGQGQAAQNQFGTAQGTISSTNPTYTDFMKTGGFSPSDETTYLNRATQGVSGTYDVLEQAAERQRAAAGGLGTGGEFSQMARQGTQQQALATENAQADLKQQENANKLAGAAGEVQAGTAETGVGQGLSNLYGQTNSLYNTQTGQITAQGAQVLQALGIQYNTQAEAAAILANLSNNPGTLSNIRSIAGMAASGLSGIAGAFA